MKKALLAMLLTCSMCAMAQYGDSMKHDKAGKKETLTGCVVEKDGKYLLADAKHPDGVELVSSEDLKAHVGHKVRVSGTMGSAMAGDNMGHDSMGHDSMGKDSMGKDSMGKDSMAKDDKMGKDSMAKDDKMGKDSMAKDDNMGHDSMGHGSAMALNVSKFEMRSATCELKK